MWPRFDGEKRLELIEEITLAFLAWRWGLCSVPLGWEREEGRGMHGAKYCIKQDVGFLRHADCYMHTRSGKTFRVFKTDFYINALKVNWVY